MKKIYILIASVLVTSGLFAQRTATENVLPENYHMAPYTFDGLRDVNDTLGPTALEGCDGSPILSGVQDGGWAVGGNVYGDLEKAQFIDAEGTGSIYSTLAWIGAKVGGTNESYSAKIYSGDVTNGPDAVLGTSSPVNYADLDTTGLYTTFSFDTPLDYSTPFFVSYEVSSGDAWYGLVHTGGSCGGNSAWEMWNDDSWHAMNDAWDGDFDIIIYTFVEVETVVTGLEDTNLIERGSQKVFPNPANESAQLVYSLVNPTDITVRVYTTTGKLVDSFYQGVQNTGLNVLDLNTQDYTQGLYLYTIETENGVRNGKFSVVR